MIHWQVFNRKQPSSLFIKVSTIDQQVNQFNWQKGRQALSAAIQRKDTIAQGGWWMMNVWVVLTRRCLLSCWMWCCLRNSLSSLASIHHALLMASHGPIMHYAVIIITIILTDWLALSNKILQRNSEPIVFVSACRCLLMRLMTLMDVPSDRH